MKYVEFEKNLKDCNLMLSRLCIKFSKNRLDAEDLYQETIFVALKNYHKYRQSEPFDRWIYKICTNTFINQYRRFKRQPKLYDFKSNEEQEIMLSNLSVIEENIDEHIDLHQIINALDYEKKVVIVLYYFNDLSIKEIAHILKKPQGTIKKRLYLARNTIKERLENND